MFLGVKIPRNSPKFPVVHLHYLQHFGASVYYQGLGNQPSLLREQKLTYFRITKEPGYGSSNLGCARG